MSKRSVLSALVGCAAFVIASVLPASADVPRPEYPRPQFERSEWVNLNGQITVPFAPQCEPSGHNHIFI